MKSDERRKSIANLLLSETRPVSGGELSELYGVSRQIIVRDISILKNVDITFYPRIWVTLCNPRR